MCLDGLGDGWKPPLSRQTNAHLLPDVGDGHLPQQRALHGRRLRGDHLPVVAACGAVVHLRRFLHVRIDSFHRHVSRRGRKRGKLRQRQLDGVLSHGHSTQPCHIRDLGLLGPPQLDHHKLGAVARVRARVLRQGVVLSRQLRRQAGKPVTPSGKDHRVKHYAYHIMYFEACRVGIFFQSDF